MTGGVGANSNSYRGFIRCGEYELWACLEQVIPLSNIENKKICVILCNPLLDERITCQPYYVYFANYLAQCGISSLRFDYAGTGESMPPRPTYSLGKYALQVDLLVNSIRNTKQFDAIGLFGVSSSSLIISQLLAQPGIDYCICWEPVLKAQQYVKSLFRANILEQQTIFQTVKYDSAQLDSMLKLKHGFVVEGHEITADFVGSIKQDFAKSILHCDYPLRLECFKGLSFNKLKKTLDDSSKTNVSCLHTTTDAMFWRSATIKYLELPLPSMKESVKWILETVV